MRTPVLILLFISLCGATVPMDRNVWQNQTEDATYIEREGCTPCAGRCNGEVCDPDRYGELTGGLSGYNIFIGEPYFLYHDSDPGITRQIFNPATPTGGVKGRMSLTGITLQDIGSCTAELNSKIVTTVQQVRERMRESVSSGSGSGIKQKADVTAQAGPVGVSGTLEMSVSSEFGTSKTMQRVTKHLSNENRAIFIQDLTCATAVLKINSYSMPKFTDGFRNALIALNEVNEKTPTEKTNAFKKFTNEYGTHYMNEVKFGAKLTYSRLLTKKSREDFRQENVDKCTVSKKGLTFLFFSTRKSRSECLTTDENKENKVDIYVKNEFIRTRGSKLPSDADYTKWAEQTFTPVPLNIKLVPIEKLMEDDILNQDDELKGKINGEKLRGWFEKMKQTYCSVLQYNCEKPKGECGIADGCSFNQLCKMEGKVAKCLDIPVEFTAKVRPEGEQFLVTWVIPQDRFGKLTFKVNYRTMASSAWTSVDLSGIGKELQFVTKMPTTETDHQRYMFKVEAYDDKNKLVNTAHPDDMPWRELTRVAIGDSCTTNIQCSTVNAECRGGKCHCRPGYYDRPTYCIPASQVQEELSLDGADSDGPYGTWGDEWVKCPENQYVYGYQMRSYHDCGDDCDDIALTNLRLFCHSAGLKSEALPSTTLTAPNGINEWGDWMREAACSGNQPANGFKIRIYRDSDNDDEVGATDVVLGCKGGGEIVADASSSSRGWGDWSNFYRCPDGFALAGFKSRVYPCCSDNFDDTAYCGVRMLCRKYD